MKNRILILISTLLVTILLSCNNSTDTTKDGSGKVTTPPEGEGISTLAIPSGNQIIISYNQSGDTLYTYITQKDSTVNLSYTYKVTRIDTVWRKKGSTAPPTNLPPSVNAGSSQTINLPTNSVTLSGSASDPDGTISSINWTKLSGGSGTITSTSQLSTTVTGLVVGAYSFKLTVTDNGGASSSSNVTVTVNPEVIIPPPVSGSIEGYGADAVGGANSTNVYHVTNLSASGSGSLANGIGSNKTIVFDVEGVIKARLYVAGVSYLTIDAYSSQKDITVETTQGDAMSVENSHHILIRGIRFRHAGSDGNDCLNVVGNSHDVAIDHCTGAYAYDGNIDLAATESAGRNFTVQWCMMYGNKGSGNMLITTQNASVHHNLFIGTQSGESAERNPYAHSNYSPKGSSTSPNFDFRNNLVNATGRYASGNGYGAVGNYINNYYTSNKAGLINLCADNASCGTAYVSGNYNQAKASGGNSISTEYSVPAKNRITTTDAKVAARAVLQSAGTYKKNSDEIKLINAITIAQ